MPAKPDGLATTQVKLFPNQREETREDRQDKLREKIATLLVLLLVGEIGGIGAIFVFAVIAQWAGKSFDWSTLRDLIGLILTSTITLVGTALGFYFGAKAEGKKYLA